MHTQRPAFFANLARVVQQLRTRIRGAGMLDYAVIIGLIAVFSIVSLTSTGTNVSRLLCLASDGIRVHALGQEAQCPDETIVAEGPTEDNGGGQGAVVEPPVEDGFVFDTTGLVFPNIILDEGTTAPQTILTNFAGIYSTNVEYQVRRLEGSSPLDVTTTRSAVVTTAGVITPLSTAFQNNAWTSWRTITPENVVQIGLAMTPPSAPTATLAALYEVALRPVGRPSLTETFTFSVSRVGGDVVFNPTIEVANITLPAGTVDDQQILFPLSGVFNTDLRYQVRRNGADNITATTYEQIQHTNGNLRYGDVGSGSFQDNATSMSSLIKPTQTQALGLRMGVSPNIFVEAQAQYDLLLWSVERPEDVRTFTFSVTRPAEVVVFEPTLAVENVVLAAGTTDLQTLHFPFGGTINTGVIYQVQRLESTNMEERTYGSHHYQGTNYTAGSVAGNDTLTTTNTTWTLNTTKGTTQAGVRVTPSADIFVDSFGAYEILIASVERPDDVRRFTFTVTRPAQAVVFEPSLDVQDVVLAAGTTGLQTVHFPFGGTINTGITYQVRRLESTNMDERTYGSHRYQSTNYTAGYVAGNDTLTTTNTTWTVGLTQGTTQAGVRITPATNVYVDSFGAYEILMASVERPDDVRRFTFTITRPAQPVAFDPTFAVADVVLPAGATGSQTIQFPFGGTINTGITYQVRRLESVNMGDRTYTSYRYKETDYAPSSILGDDTLLNTTWTLDTVTNTTQAGVRITPSSNAFVDSSALYEVVIASAERPDDVRRFTFTVTRPAQTVVFEPTLAVEDVLLAAGSTESQNIFFPLGGTFNTNILYKISRIDATNMADQTYGRYQTIPNSVWSAGSAQGNTTSAGTTWRPSALADITNVGITITPSSNLFLESVGSYEILLASVERPDDVRRFPFTVTRPANPMAFDPQLATQDVVLAAGVSGEQSVTFPLTFAQPTTATNLLFDVRRVSATNLGTTTAPQFVRVTDTVGTLTDISNDTPSQQWTLPTSTKGLGVRIITPTDPFLDATGTYEIRVAPADLPQNVRVFTFTVTRPAQPLDFNLTLAAQDTTIPVGTTGTVEVLFDLTGTANTDARFTFERLSGPTPLAGWTYARHQNASGVVSNLGGSASATYTINSTIVPSTTRKLGVSLQMPTNTFEAAEASFRISLASTRTPTDVKTYTFTVTRTADTVRFNPVVAVQNTVLPIDTTGWQEVMFDLSGEINTGYTYTLEQRNSTNLAATISRYRNASGNITGGNNTGSNTLSIPSYTLAATSAQQLGVRVEFPSNPFIDARATYTLRLTSTQDPTQVRAFSFTLERTSKTLIFEPTLATQNVVLNEGTTGRQDVMVDLGGTINSDMVLRVRRTSGTITGYLGARVTTQTGAVTGSQSTTNTNVLTFPETYPTSTRKVGVRIDLSTNPYIEQSGTYEIHLHSPNNPSDVRIFPVTITRTATPVIFTPSVAASNVTVPMGTTTRQQVLFDLTGEMNTSFVYSVRRLSGGTFTGNTWGIVRTNTNAINSTNPESQNNTYTFPQTYPSTTQQVGVQLDLSSNIFIEQSSTYEIAMYAPDRPNDVRTWTFTVTRTPTPVVFEPTIAASNITLPAGTTTRQQVLFDLTGEMNTSFVYRVRRLSGGTFTGNTSGIVRTNTNAINTTNPESQNNTYTFPQTYPSTTQQVGVQLDVSTNPYIEQSSTYEIAMHAPDRPSDVRTRTFTITRPAQPMTFTVTPAVQNITLPAGSTATPDILFDLTGSADTNVVYNLRRVSSSNASAWSYPLVRTNGTVSSLSGFVFEGNINHTLTRPATDQIGVRIQMPTHTNQDIVMTYQITLTPSLQTSPATSRSYTFTVTRPKL